MRDYCTYMTVLLFSVVTRSVRLRPSLLLGNQLHICGIRLQILSVLSLCAAYYSDCPLFLFFFQPQATHVPFFIYRKMFPSLVTIALTKKMMKYNASLLDIEIIQTVDVSVVQISHLSSFNYYLLKKTNHVLFYLQHWYCYYIVSVIQLGSSFNLSHVVYSSKIL